MPLSLHLHKCSKPVLCCASWSLPSAEGRILHLHCWSHSRFQCSESKHYTPSPQVWNGTLGNIHTSLAHIPGESLQITASASGTLSLFLLGLHLLCLKNLGVVHSLSPGRGCRHPSLKIHSRKASKGRKTPLAFLFPSSTGSLDGIWERLVYSASGCSADHFFDSLQQICSHKMFEISLQPESAKVSPGDFSSPFSWYIPNNTANALKHKHTQKNNSTNPKNQTKSPNRSNSNKQTNQPHPAFFVTIVFKWQHWSSKCDIKWVFLLLKLMLSLVCI